MTIALSEFYSVQTKVKGILIPGHKYSVKIAETALEPEEVFRLHCDVFNIELNEGLESMSTQKMGKVEYDARVMI